MSGKKNEAFENAWSLYSDKIKRKRMEKFLPGVARLFSSGNKMQAEQEFNAEMRALIYPNESGGSLSLIANELAWASSGKIPASKMDDINGNDGGGNKGREAATSTMLSRLRNSAIQYFSENPDELENAERYPVKVKQFKDEGYDDKTSALYALPTDKFKQLAQNMDTKAGMIYSGKDNEKRSVASSFYDAGYKPEDLKDPTDAKRALSKITGGNLSETLSEEKNLDNLEQYARDMGFVNSDALLDYLATSYDRSNRLREQEDDNILTKAAKGVAISNINKKWDEGVPANTKDVVHDVVDDALIAIPQEKVLKAVRYTPKVVKALSSGGKVASAVKAVDNPWTRFVASNAYVPLESAYAESLLGANENGMDWGNVATQTVGSMAAESVIGRALKSISNRLGSLPLKSYKSGELFATKKDVLDDMERRAYEIALEKEAADKAHNAMLKFNYENRTPSALYRALNQNKGLKKYGLTEDQFDRVFNSAYKSAKQEGSDYVQAGSRDLSAALKDISSYKNTRDFKNAVEAAAWERAGLEGPLVLDILRTRKGDSRKQALDLANEKANIALQGRLMDIFDKYQKAKGARKFFEYEAVPTLKGLINRGAVVHNVYRDFPLYGVSRFLNLSGDNKEK